MKKKYMLKFIDFKFLEKLMIIKILIFCLNNDKMQNFSQINKSKNLKKQIAIQDSIQFKIQPPTSQRKIKQFIPQSSFFDQSQKSSSSVLKNTARTSYSDRLQEQYISFKLKPSINKPYTQKENKVYNINFDQKTNPQFYNKFIENQLQNLNSEINSLSKSPQFLCKKTSPINSQKESFEEQFQQKFNLRNVQNQDEYDLKKENDKFIINKTKIKTNHLGNFSQFIQKRKSLEKNEFKLFQDQEYQDYEDYSPYKQLREQYEIQQKFQRAVKFQEACQFDSFNQSNQKNKSNFIQFDKKNKPIFDYFESFQRQANCQNEQKQKSLKKRINNQIQNKDTNKEFFFLTDPTIESSTGKKQSKVKNKQISKTPKQKQVREFCFNISQLKFDGHREPETYCNPNLFSNSNQYHTLFDSKNFKKEDISQNSKRMHVRQLVQEFIQQLQHIDEKSLNQKVVNNLQNVLEEIVFKQPKKKCDLIIIEEEVLITPRQKDIETQIKDFYDDNKFKKWTKPKRDQNQVSCQRKIFNQLSDLKYQKYENFSELKQSNLSTNSVLPSRYTYEKVKQLSPIADKDLLEKKQNKKPVIYKPNFDISPSKSLFRHNNKKQQSTQQKNLMFSKNRQGDSSQIKINPKGSIYFNNKKSHSRQHLKTETSRKTWRVY